MNTIARRVGAAWNALTGSDAGRRADEATTRDLARRVAHLESELEGLQDAVYRQDVMHDRQIADLREDR